MARTAAELLVLLNDCCEGEDADAVLQVLQHMLINLYNVYRANGHELNLRDSLQRFVRVIDDQLAAEGRTPRMDDSVPPDRTIH